MLSCGLVDDLGISKKIYRYTRGKMRIWVFLLLSEKPHKAVRLGLCTNRSSIVFSVRVTLKKVVLKHDAHIRSTAFGLSLIRKQ